MSREAMQMALEALELYQSKSSVQMFDDAVKALRQALETEQKPVAWASSLDFDDDDQEIIPAKDKGKLGTSNCDIALYTAPPKHDYVIDCPRCGHCCAEREWVGLTEEEINNSYLFWVVDQQDVLGFGKALETKLKRKNT